MILKIIFLTLFLACALIISRQDFKERLISLWIILVFCGGCAASVWLLEGIYALLSYTLSSLTYFTFCFLVLILFYFLKERKIRNIIDTKIGLGDVLVMLAIGITLDIIPLILFFTSSFIISAVIGLFLAKKHKTVPLAGILTVLFFFYKGWDYLL
jgi:hypothetical protein